MKQLLALFALAPALAGCGSEPQVAGDTTVACKVALRYVELVKASSRSKLPILVTAGDAQPLSGLDTIARGFANDPVAPAMLTELAARKGKNALDACPNLGAELTRRGIAHQRDGKTYAYRSEDADGDGDADGYKYELVSVTLPVVSANGNEALVEASSIVGPEAGVGQIHHLRHRPLFGWRITDAVGTWIS